MQEETIVKLAGWISRKLYLVETYMRRFLNTANHCAIVRNVQCTFGSYVIVVSRGYNAWFVAGLIGMASLSWLSIPTTTLEL